MCAPVHPGGRGGGHLLDPPDSVTTPNITPVMAGPEILVQMTNVQGVSLEGVKFHHADYKGLDRNMNFQQAAVVVKVSSGGCTFLLLLRITHKKLVL